MIGKKIKYYRKQVNLTLQEIANRTGLSLGYLSNLERDLTSPTFDNLCNICAAMSISVVDLIMNTVSHQVCVRKSERKSIYALDYRTKYEYTTDENLDMQGMCLTLSADYNGTEVSWGHDTDEYGLVAKGALAFEVNGETYVLEEGDAIYIKAGTPHKWSKIGDGECISYWTKLNYIKVASSDSYREQNAAPENKK
ncbi:DNA-binding protein [Oscillospiraceae bacterium]|nr:DNA-binding protein [Oscillospiraceae bacterium]BDF73735.1 DNA-binding protein [Oscillospiraceae bacterium]